MKRTLTILLVGLLVAVLALGAVAPTASAHGDDAERYQTENATDATAASLTEWMSVRMGPDGVEAFEQETGTTVEVVAHAMAEQMVNRAGTWNDSRAGSWNYSAGTPQYGPGWDSGYQAPGGGYGPGMGPGMHHRGDVGSAWGVGPGAGDANSVCGGYGTFGGPSANPGYSPRQDPGMYGGQGQGFFGGWGPENWFNSGPGGHGGHGMGGR